MIALLLAFAMTAAQTAAGPYRAQGPGWTLTIGERLRFEPRGGAPIDVRTPPAPVSEFGTRRYATDRLSVSVQVGFTCTDRETRRRYADSVFVTVGREEKAGCGGAVLAADDLTDTSWQFVEINGAAVTPDMAGYSLDIASDMVLGYSRCNRFSASLTREGATFRFAWIGSTMTRCPPPHDAHDLVLRRIFSGRAGPVRISQPDPDTLLLSADMTVRLRRVPEQDYSSPTGG